MILELRKYQCSDCKGLFWVSCDDDYPKYCAHCGAENYKGEDHVMSFTKSDITIKAG